MTLVLDRPAGDPARPAAVHAATSSSLVGYWRFAARLARREVRRRPGRSALVAALVAVPVMGMTVASVLATSTSDPWAEQFARRAGASDVLVTASRLTRLDDAELASLLPPDSTWERSTEAFAPLRTNGEVPVAEYVLLTDLDVAAPLTAGIVEVVEGRSPAAGEVLLSSDVADSYGVAVGDVLALSLPDVEWEVSGIGRLADSYDQSLAVAGEFDFTQIRAAYRSESLRIDVPFADEGRLAEVSDALAERVGGEVTSSVAVPDPTDDDVVESAALAWGWVAGTIALGAVGIIITAAFATSARRQLTTIGQLAANGAPSSLVRRTLGLQGSWSGLLGALVGLGGACVVLLLGRPLAERLVGRDFGSYDVAATHLAVIVATAVGVATIAALVPARSASRIPVLAALAGRRPLGAVPRRLVPVGVALFGCGLVLLLAAAGSSADSGSSANLEAATAVLGGLGVLAGMCCVSPLAVDSLRRVPAAGAARLATRSLVRHRTRSAAVVTAIAAVGALAVAGATFAGQLATTDDIDGVPDVPLDAALVTPYYGGDPTRLIEPAPPAVPEDLRTRLAEIVPGARLAVRRIAGFDPPSVIDDTAAIYLPADVVIADQPMLDLIGLSDHDAGSLQRSGALLMNEWMPRATPEVVVRTAAGDVRLDAPARRDLPQSWGGHAALLITQQRAEDVGWRPIDGGLIMRSERDLTAAQRTAIGELSDSQTLYAAYVDEPIDASSAPDNGLWDWYTQVEYRSTSPSRALIETAIIGVAVALTLIVVAIGLALAASEGRDERDVLMAVGARPALMRRLAAFRAVAMVGLAALLAVPTGYLPLVVVMRAVDEGTPRFPWLTAAALLVGVPLVAAATAWIGSNVALRVRPVRMSTLAID